MNNESPKQSKQKSYWLYLAIGFFLIYVANILMGIVSNAFEFEAFFELGDVLEFLALFAAIICFVVEVLKREAQRDKNKSDNTQITPK